MPKYIELEAKVIVASEEQMGNKKERPVSDQNEPDQRD